MLKTNNSFSVNNNNKIYIYIHFYYDKSSEVYSTVSAHKPDCFQQEKPIVVVIQQTCLHAYQTRYALCVRNYSAEKLEVSSSSWKTFCEITTCNTHLHSITLHKYKQFIVKHLHYRLISTKPK